MTSPGHRVVHSALLRGFRVTNRIVARWGLQLVEHLPVPGVRAAVSVLDAGVGLLLGLSSRGPVTIVSVGAGHTPSLGDPDPVADFLTSFPERVARAILVEPVPVRLEQLRRLVGDDPRFSFVGVAVAEDSGTLRLWRIDAWADRALLDKGFGTEGGPSGGHGWTSGDREHVIGLLAQRLGIDAASAADHVVPIDVPSLRLRDLLYDHGIDHVDYLQVDVEGSDDEVILSLDLDRVQPNVIRCEFVHVPAQRRTRLASELAAHGYAPAIRASGMDAVFVRSVTRN